jgi:hypothetical protein
VLNDGRVLLVGGRDPNNPILPCEIYDPVKDKWTVTGSLNEGRYRFEMVQLPDGRVMIGGGLNQPDGSGSTTSSCEVYDPATGVWTKLDPMSYPREIFAAVVMPDSSVVMHAGLDAGSTNFLAQSDVYTSALKKTSGIPDIITPHYAMNIYYSTAFRGLISRGGQLGGGGGPSLSEVELWHLGSNHWEFGNPSTDPHSTPSRSAVQLSDESILIPSGRYGAGTVAYSIELFDCGSLKWRTLDPIQIAHDLSCVVTLDNDTSVVIGGSGDPGVYNRVLNICTFIDPKSGKNWEGPALNVERYRHSTVVLRVPDPNDPCVHVEKIMAIGGYDGNNTALNSCEVLDLGVRANAPAIQVTPDELNIALSSNCSAIREPVSVAVKGCSPVILDSISTPSSNFQFALSKQLPLTIYSDSTVRFEITSISTSDSSAKVLKLYFHSVGRSYVRYIHVDSAWKNPTGGNWLTRQPSGVTHGYLGKIVSFPMHGLLSGILNVDSLIRNSLTISYTIGYDQTELQYYSFAPPAGWVTASQQINSGVATFTLVRASQAVHTLPYLGTVSFTVLAANQKQTPLALSTFTLATKNGGVGYCIQDGEGTEWKILLDSSVASVSPESAANTSFTVYPNPSNKTLTLEYLSAESKQVKISVADILGREITSMHREIRAHEGKNAVEFSTEGLADGTYMLRVESDGSVATRQVYVMHP